MEERSEEDDAPSRADDGVTRRRVPLPEWAVTDIDTGEYLGTIVWNSAARSLDAHCHQCQHRGGRLACNVNRTVNVPRSHGSHVGRPLAFLLAWLHCGRHYPDRKSHFDARLGRGEDAQYLTHPVRVRFRRLVEDDIYWADCRKKERRPFMGEDLEPMGIP